MSSRAALVPLVALVLGVLGALAFQTPAAGVTDRPDSDIGEALLALTRSQERTAQALERLEQHLAAGLTSPRIPDQRAPAGPAAADPGPSSLPELIASLDALRRSLAEESRLTRETIRSAPAMGGERLVDVRDERTEPDWLALGHLRTAWRSDQAQAKRSQNFQTARDMLRNYGPPTAVYNQDNGMMLHYQRAEGTPSWYFKLSDGLVVQFWMEDVGGE